MGEEKKPRDLWDKLTIFFSILTPLLLGIFGFLLNAKQTEINELLKKQELQISAANSIEKFFNHLRKDADQSLQLAALTVIYSIGFQKEAVDIAKFNQSSASVRFLENVPSRDREQKAESIEYLKKISLAASEEPVQKQAQKALQMIVMRTSERTVLNQADKALKDIDLASKEAWGVVIGGDKDLPAAQHEAKNAEGKGLKAEIFLRQNVYRTVIRFPNKERAQANLAEVREKTRQDAYLVNINTWCPNATLRQEGNYYFCGE